MSTSTVLNLSKATEKFNDLYSDGDWTLLYDASLNGIEIEPTDEESPMCWDAGVEIHGGNIVINGGAGASGYGDVTIKYPKHDTSLHTFKISFYEDGMDHDKNVQDKIDQVRKLLTEAGVKMTEEED